MKQNRLRPGWQGVFPDFRRVEVYKNSSTSQAVGDFFHIRPVFSGKGEADVVFELSVGWPCARSNRSK